VLFRSSQIKDQQNGIILKNFSVSDTYTIKAGSLLHLKADIKGEIDGFELKSLLSTLHPTPAVCGLPKEAAKSFILANENYDRRYYTGFLGEINVDSETELFVNLRCVEIDGAIANIYVGGGITEESKPEKEWLETCQKTNTIKSVL
jgi:isochorismate synthase